MLDLIFSFAGNGCDHAHILDYCYYYIYYYCCITSDEAWWFALNFLEGKEEVYNKEFSTLPLNLTPVTHPPLSELLIASRNIPPTLYTHIGVRKNFKCTYYLPDVVSCSAERTGGLGNMLLIYSAILKYAL